ncbi:ATP-dependent DNA helicase [Streptomyces aidingensis]|uniref:DNA 3'-5' helicase n=1 Tax=Streptomyces aidingensis TaxID=910347 RepID=A0A1I1EYG7_9ACTN|nr:ATP-dependent DNA helicase [Streptomyces aidingensis]SFB91776.1 DNA helicase-2 / ATP-dependent DNA helicase PcrA [Streptomyces aidingensis]
MSLSSFRRPAAGSVRLRDPEELKELLGIPFTPEQLACITAPLAPQVIVAGAGSGKTTVMAARVVWLVVTGQVAPEQVLGLTFTNKAAGELAERVTAALHKAGVLDPMDTGPAAAAERAAGGTAGEDESPPGEPEISTYHAFAGRLLTEHGLRIGIEPASQLLADASQFQLAAEVLRSAPAAFAAPTSLSGAPRRFPDLVGDLIQLDAALSEHLVEPADLRRFDQTLPGRLPGPDTLFPPAEGGRRPRRLRKQEREEIARTAEAARGRLQLLELVEEYRARKRSRDLLDFGDQIALSARLARDTPETGRALRERYAVVLLDEYQDTSVAQRILLSGLFGSGTGHPVTAVGDPCQAIYGWRGASVANLDDFPGHFPHADGTPATRFTLSENRRSGGRLLTLANRLAAPLRTHHPGTAPLRPADGQETDGRIRVALHSTHAEELDWLAGSIAHLIDTGTPPGSIAVLSRTARDFPEIQRVLGERRIPAEIVGLSGLLHLPEVADLVAVCRVLADPTANAALVRLLSGPRWRIGPRDLAMLGRRAREMVRRPGPGEEDEDQDALRDAAAGADPTETVSLADALDTFAGGDIREPDDGLPFSDEARIRFAHFAAELRELRRTLSDPLMDTLHRVLAVTGLDIELSASPQALAARRRETLDAFLAVAADFASGRRRTALDQDATLPAFLAYLRAAEEHDNGLDSTLPAAGSGENTVKVLTAHRAKGLEWDVVVLPGLYEGRGGFPSTRIQESWLKYAHTLPGPLRGDAATRPAIGEWSPEGLESYHDQEKSHTALEELRLAYVAVTRPRSLLLASGHRWGPEQKRPRTPSPYLDLLREYCEREPAAGEVEVWAGELPEGAENPVLAEEREELLWPMPLDEEAARRRREAAELVLAELRALPATSAAPAAPAAPAVPHQTAAGPEAGGAPPAADDSGGLTPEELRAVASWDRDLEVLATELRRSRQRVREVELPVSLSASQLQRLAADPDSLARELARPMPRPPQPAARRGTRFHAWVESRFEELALPLLGLEELPGGDEPGGEPDTDQEVRDERDLEALKEAFLRTSWARRTPYRVEVPFQLRIAGHTIRGRMDAVYRDGDRYEIIDWKTGRDQNADPLQLAIYRVAWSERRNVPVNQISAAFLYVRTGELVRPYALPDRTGLERILQGDTSWSLNAPG